MEHMSDAALEALAAVTASQPEPESNERAQVEQVFGLTDGDLEESAWVPTYQRETWNFNADATGNHMAKIIETTPFTFTYWSQGVPEYVQSEYDAMPLSYAPTYRTVIRNEMFGQVPETVTDDEGTWTVVARYSTSGETECPLRHEGRTTTVSRYSEVNCSLCDAAPGEAHSYVYIGDGWAEIVYRLEPKPRTFVATD